VSTKLGEDQFFHAAVTYTDLTRINIKYDALKFHDMTKLFGLCNCFRHAFIFESA
jgi:hypothetical protein